MALPAKHRRISYAVCCDYLAHCEVSSSRSIVERQHSALQRSSVVQIAVKARNAPDCTQEAVKQTQEYRTFVAEVEKVNSTIVAVANLDVDAIRNDIGDLRDFFDFLTTNRLESVLQSLDAEKLSNVVDTVTRLHSIASLADRVVAIKDSVLTIANQASSLQGCVLFRHFAHW